MPTLHTYTVRDYSTVSGNLLDERSGLLPEVAYAYARACASNQTRVAHITRDGTDYGVVIIRHDDDRRAAEHNIPDVKAHCLAMMADDRQWVLGGMPVRQPYDTRGRGWER
jgi:hypothetical protein